MSDQVPFAESESGFYKILSSLDSSKCLTVQQSGTKPLVLDNYKGTNNQKFNIFNNNGKFALVSAEGNSGIFVSNDSPQDGAPLQADSNQHNSSFFQVLKANNVVMGFYIKSVSGKCIDVFEGKTQPGTPIIQWSFHGHTNQIWLIVPADEQQPANIGNNNVAANISAFPQVPPNFAPVNSTYKILSVINTTKALTVTNQDHELKISDYVADPSQKFNVYQNANKIALVVSSTNEGLCVFKDSVENGGSIRSDSGQHPSSWFEAVRASKGEWANKAYILRTHAGQKALDIAQGNIANGTKVVQYAQHGNANQIWLIVPSEQPVPKYQQKGGNGQGNGGIGGIGGLFGINLPNIQMPNLPNLPNIGGFPKFG